jgi:hypothetical protein
MSSISQRRPERRLPGPRLGSLTPLLIGVLALGTSSCSDSEPTAEVTPPGAAAPTLPGPTPARTGLPARIEIADPEQPVTRLEFVEDATEEAADRLLAFSDRLRKRDFSAAAEFLSPRFAGESLDGLEMTRPRTLSLGTRELGYDPDSGKVLGRAEFIDGLRELTSSWMHVESVIWKVKGAEFETTPDSWGKLRLFVHLTGQRTQGGWASIAAWGHGRVVREAGQWVLERFDLESLTTTERLGSIFTDVSTSAGVAHTGIRFGQPGNTSYAFNGVAGADVDADGRWDIFVPSDGENFLYLMQPDGTYRNEAEQCGVAQPDAGTGAVFFDFDNDGDQDLMVGQVGWREKDGSLGGRAIQLYVNDGKGGFEERGAEFGLGSQRFVSYSLTVFDYDGDGWLDVYVCGYGRLEVEHNNSWIEATNGAPNALLRNLGGRGFEDVAAQLGVAGKSWSYASAAADYDGDGDVDLYVANDYGTNRLYENRGPGRFEDVAVERGVEDIGNGMGVSWGDLDADGRLDLYVSNMSSTAGNRILGRLDNSLDKETHALLTKLAAGNSIFIAREDGGFERLPKSAGGVNGSWAWSSVLCDLDLDGFLDVYLANGFVTGDQPFDT